MDMANKTAPAPGFNSPSFLREIVRGRRSERRGILPALANRPVARDFLAIERIRGSLCARERGAPGSRPKARTPGRSRRTPPR